MKLETIKIKKEHQNSIKEYGRILETYRIAIFESSSQIRKTEKQMFDAIYEVYPELKKYHLSVNHETFEIHILGEK